MPENRTKSVKSHPSNRKWAQFSDRVSTEDLEINLQNYIETTQTLQLNQNADQGRKGIIRLLGTHQKLMIVIVTGS